MARIQHQAVVEAIYYLSGLGISKAVASAISCYLVGKRIEQIGLGPKADVDQPKINHYDEVVQEMFVLLPGNPKGRLDPFRSVSTMWQNPELSGRKTVWNVASRGGGEARKLFNEHADKGPHPKGGLKSDAADILGTIIDASGAPKPDAAALAAIILRDQEISDASSPAALSAALADHLGITADELAKFTQSSNPPVLDLSDGPQWNPDDLPDDLKPDASSDVDPDGDWRSAWLASSPGDILLDERVRHMVIRAVRSSPAVLLVGPPGTGKTQFLKQLVSEIADAPADFGFDPIRRPMVVTPDESWTTRELVGGETVVDGELEFARGYVLNAIHEDRWLILDEINRADMDRIFGGVFTWLSDSEVLVGHTGAADGQRPIHLGWTDESASQSINVAPGGEEGSPQKYLAGKNWRLLGTYNAVDAQRVFRFGHALGRRFVRVPFPPPDPDVFVEAAVARCMKIGLDESCVPNLTVLYKAHLPQIGGIPPLGPAVFIRMLDYLRGTMMEDGATVPDGALAEAYVANLGHYLARVEQADLAQLKTAVVPTAISASDWEWLVELVKYA